jgi:NhaA family Na+:H+ antiporter
MISHLSRHTVTRDEKPIRFLFENSAFLIMGALIALVWVNSSEQGRQVHQYFFNGFQLSQMFDPQAQAAEDGGGHAADSSDPVQHGHEHGEGADEPPTDRDDSLGPVREDVAREGAEGSENGASTSAGMGSTPEGHGHGITWHFVINDILMALFFAMAAKEVWESLLPGGALSNFKTAAMPLLATAGGVVGPAILFTLGALIVGQYNQIGNGWAVPCATDIAFSYLIGRFIFGNGHPAIAFLLLLAIADDAAGLVIIALFYPQESPELIWLLLSLAGMVIAFIMAKMRVQSFWWYLLIPGVLSWFGFHWSHIHPALGLVPIIPLIPHSQSDMGVFARVELNRHDTLSEFQHWWKNPVEIILGLFGLCNAGVAFSTVGVATWLIMIALVVGKPLGITLCTYVGDKFLGLTIPKGMDYRDVVTLGCVAGIGFTVALFVATAAFKSTDPNLDPVKMGALLSFGAAIVSLIVAKILGVQNWKKKSAAMQ